MARQRPDPLPDVISLGVLFDDAVIVAVGLAVGAGGIALLLGVGHAALEGTEAWLALTSVCSHHLNGGQLRMRARRHAPTLDQ